MNDKERAIYVMELSMAGNLAAAVYRVALRENRAPTEEEVEFLSIFETKTCREIADFCFARDIEPCLLIGITPAQEGEE